MEINPKVALIIGITGQDGSYLAKLLLEKGYIVYGTSRDSDIANLQRLEILNIKNKIKLVTTLSNDFKSVCKTILDIKPTEIYNLGGLTSVALSFEHPIEAIDSIVNSTINWMEGIRLLSPEIRFFNAGSSEFYGDNKIKPADENTPLSPKSPYAISKATSFWCVKHYRESYNLKCCTGILSNHESPLRGERFVTQKIIRTARLIKKGEKISLKLGNTDIFRDWGWCADYVEAIHKMLTNNQKWEDFIIATGESHSLNEFIKLIFDAADLDSSKYIEIDKSLFRPNELIYSKLNPSNIKNVLGWEAKHTFKEVALKLYQDQLF